jgi:hypothetical protein
MMMVWPIILELDEEAAAMPRRELERRIGEVAGEVDEGRLMVLYRTLMIVLPKDKALAVVRDARTAEAEGRFFSFALEVLQTSLPELEAIKLFILWMAVGVVMEHDITGEAGFAEGEE